MYPKCNQIINFLTILFWAIFPAITGHAQEWGKVTEAELKVEAPPDYPEANAIILFDIGKMHIGAEIIEFTRHVRIKVLNKAGITEIGDIEIPYWEGDKIVGLKAQTITPDGKKHEVQKKDIFDKVSGEYKAKSFSFPAITEYSILEYTYENRNKRFHRLDPWYFQSGLYTLSSEFCLVLDWGYTYSTATINVPSANQIPTERKMTNINDPLGSRSKAFTWKMTNLPPIKDEPYMSFRRGYMATLYCQLVYYRDIQGDYTYDFVKDWRSLGEQFQKMIDEYIDEKNLIKKLADSLIGGLPSNAEKAKAIYYFVSKEIATKESENYHYFDNDKLSKLLVAKTGTADEKNILLCQMYLAAGMQSYPVLIGTRHSQVFIPQLYQIHQFNHIITIVDVASVRYFLDATNKYCSFGVLPPKSRAVGGLLLDGKNSALLAIVAIEPKSSRIEKNVIHIDGDSLATCSTSVKFTGYYAINYGEDFDQTEPEKFIKDYFLDKLDVEYEIDTFTCSSPNPELFLADFVFSPKNYFKILDNSVSLQGLNFSFRSNPFVSEKRFFPVDFQYPSVYQNTTEIAIEDSIVSFTLPEPLSFEISGASFSRNCMYDGARYIISNRLSIDKAAFSPSVYSQLRDFFTKMGAATEDPIILTRNSQ
jgi:hypothetical protein